jgi:hypothetical protein
MPRKRYVYDPEAIHADGSKGALVEVSTDYVQPEHHHYVIPDTPDYQSPVTGLMVSGRKQRRDDLKRTGSRPWEGKDAELKEAARHKAYEEKRFDRALEDKARRVFHQMDPAKRRQLERG